MNVHDATEIAYKNGYNKAVAEMSVRLHKIIIIKSALVSSADSETFLERMSKAIRSFQEEGLNVEIEYQPVSTSNPKAPIVYSALIHGLKEKNNG